MSNAQQVVDNLMEMEGAIAAVIVDLGSGMVLAQKSIAGFDTDAAAGGTTRMVQAQLDTLRLLGKMETIDDMLITLEHEYHLIRPLFKTGGEDAMFGYLVVSTKGINLAMARALLKKELADFSL